MAQVIELKDALAGLPQGDAARVVGLGASGLAVRDQKPVAVQAEVAAARGTSLTLLDRLTAADARVGAAEAALAAGVLRSAEIGTLVADRQARSRLFQGRPRKSPTGNWYSAGNVFQGWAVPLQPSKASDGVNRFTTWVPDLSTIDHFVVAVYRRPLANLNAGGPGLLAGDVQVASGTFAVADLVADPSDVSAQRCDFYLNIGRYDPANAYIASVLPYTAANAPTYMGIAQGLDVPSQSTADQQGMVRIGGTWFGLSGTQTVAFEFGERWPCVDSEAPRSPVAVAAGPLPRKAVNLANGNWQLLLPEIVIEGTTQSFVIPKNTLVTFAQPATLTETITLPIQYGGEIFTPGPYITAWSSVKSGTSTPVVDGTDVRVDRDKGTVTGLVNTGQYLADVTATWELNRNDVLVADQVTGALSVIAGTPRRADVNEFLPAVPAGKIEICRVFVTRSRNIDVMWTCRYRDHVKIADPGPDLAWVSYCRERLPGALRRLRAGLTLIVAPYADSIGEQGGGGTGAGYWYVPNGQYRDQIVGGYWQYGRIGSDVLAAQIRYSHGDTADPNHVHSGAVWTLKEALERRYQSTCTILNMCIGGSTSDNVIINGVPGGAYPDRINALVALAPHVVPVAFGMNDQDPQQLYINISTILATLLSNSIEPIVMGMPATPPLAHRRTPELMQQMNAALVAAALGARGGRGVAYIPVGRYFGDENDAIGLSPRSINGFGSVHPLFRELGILGQLLAKPFLN